MRRTFWLGLFAAAVVSCGLALAVETLKHPHAAPDPLLGTWASDASIACWDFEPTGEWLIVGDGPPSSGRWARRAGRLRLTADNGHAEDYPFVLTSDGQILSVTMSGAAQTFRRAAGAAPRER